MRLALIFLFIGLIFLILLRYFFSMQFHNNKFSIHLHDTYYILSFSFIAIFTILFLISFFCLGGIIFYGFRSNFFIIFLSLIVLADTYFIYDTFRLFKQLNETTKKIREKGLKHEE